MQEFSLTITNSLNNQPTWLDLFLQNLDPSSFQNIILGVLAIFIPFAIVFLTDILNSKKETRSEFERMVLNDEVFGTKKILLLSIIGIVFFSFFAGKDISNSAKLIAIIAAVILAYLYWIPFKKILRFSEGYKIEFEISFLKKLSFSKFFQFKNKNKAQKIRLAWNFFWSQKTEINETEFTKIFITHVSDAIKFGKLGLAILLAHVYVNNIEERDRLSIGSEILPKVFEWNEILWNKQNSKKSLESEDFWNWYYFGGKFFEAIVKVLLKDGHGPYQLFSSFKKHIDESEKKLQESTNENEKKKYWGYITGLFSNFCLIFFNEVDSTRLNFGILKNDFPPEWKITITNKNNRIARVILDEFLKWSKSRIFKKVNEQNPDNNLTDVINLLFPNVYRPLFTVFLMLFFSDEVKDVLKKEPNFYIFEPTISLSFSSKISKEKRNNKFEKMKREKEDLQVKETIQIIINFFWQTPDKKKLEEIKTEIESKEIEKICEDSDRKKSRKENLLELLKLLILEIKQ